MDNLPDGTTDIELHHNRWVSLRKVINHSRGVDGYIYSHEVRCTGRIVAIMPYRTNDKGVIEFLLRKEVCPCWDMKEQLLTCITGGVDDGVSIKNTVLNELNEEAGYTVEPDKLVSLGRCKGTKSTDTTYFLYAVDITGLTPGKAKGDGSLLEAQAENVWCDNVLDAVDPLVYTLWAKLTNTFGDTKPDEKPEEKAEAETEEKPKRKGGRRKKAEITEQKPETAEIIETTEK